MEGTAYDTLWFRPGPGTEHRAERVAALAKSKQLPAELTEWLFQTDGVDGNGGDYSTGDYGGSCGELSSHALA